MLTLESFRCPIDGSRIIEKWRCEKGHTFREVDGIIDFLMVDVPTHDLLEKVSPIYETVWAPFGMLVTSGKTYSWIMSSSAKIVGRTHLDIGTGTGKLFDFASCEECVGLDVSMNFLRQLRKRRPKVLAVRGDARKLPFSDEVFESVSSLFVLHMIDDQESAVYEMYRVMKKGGKGIVIVMSDNNVLDKILAKWWGYSLKTLDQYVSMFGRYFKVESAEKLGAWSVIRFVKT